MTKATMWAAIGWLMDRIFNPKGHYKDGRPFRTFREIRAHELLAQSPKMR